MTLWSVLLKNCCRVRTLAHGHALNPQGDVLPYTKTISDNGWVRRGFSSTRNTTQSMMLIVFSGTVLYTMGSLLSFFFLLFLSLPPLLPTTALCARGGSLRASSPLQQSTQKRRTAHSRVRPKLSLGADKHTTLEDLGHCGPYCSKDK